MSKALITESLLTDIGNAIRTKNGATALYTPSQMATAIANIPTGSAEPNLQSKSVVLSETAQNVTADSGYDGLSQVSVPGISSSYVGSGITRRDQNDLIINGASVEAPAGYYSQNVGGIVSSTTMPTPAISVDSSGLISASYTQSAGYSAGGTKSSTQQLTTQAATSVTPSTQTQTVGAAGRYMTGVVTVEGDADLVGSNIVSTANIFGVQGTVVVQHIYTGSSAPSSSTGANGDIYIQR